MDKNIINQTKGDNKLKLKIVDGLMENMETMSVNMIEEAIKLLYHGFGVSEDTILKILAVSLHIGTLSEEKYKAILERLC